MSQHAKTASPPARTYSAQPPPSGHTLTCRRCGRVHPYPVPGGQAVRCECGWKYVNRDGLIQEDFKPRLGV